MADEVTEWVDTDGNVTPLGIEWDARGRFMPKLKFDSEGVPGQPGERFREVRHDVREMLLPMRVTAASPEALHTELRAMVDRMDPTRGPGKIRVTSVLGDQREVECFYSAGLEMDEKIDDSSGPTWQTMAMSFTAFDPYWYDVSPNARTFSVTETPKFFPIFPLRLTSSEIVVDETVTVDGSVDTWPVWTISGPGSGIRLSNLTTGKFLYFTTLTLTAGQTITIDTRPGAKTVLLDDGTNLFGQLFVYSSLWPLVRGVNQISLEMAGAAPGASELTLSYKQRYLTP